MSCCQNTILHNSYSWRSPTAGANVRMRITIICSAVFEHNGALQSACEESASSTDSQKTWSSLGRYYSRHSFVPPSHAKRFDELVVEVEISGHQ